MLSLQNWILPGIWCSSQCLFSKQKEGEKEILQYELVFGEYEKLRSHG